MNVWRLESKIGPLPLPPDIIHARYKPLFAPFPLPKGVVKKWGRSGDRAKYWQLVQYGKSLVMNLS